MGMLNQPEQLPDILRRALINEVQLEVAAQLTDAVKPRIHELARAAAVEVVDRFSVEMFRDFAAQSLIVNFDRKEVMRK